MSRQQFLTVSQGILSERVFFLICTLITEDNEEDSCISSLSTSKKLATVYEDAFAITDEHNSESIQTK